jgi:outer membrane protein TolC
MDRLTMAILFGGMLVLPLAMVRPASGRESQLIKNDAAELKELQKERIAALTLLVKIVTNQYRTGTADFHQVAQAQHELLDAKLDSAGSAEERIALLEEQLKLANEAMKVAEGRFNAGRVSQCDVLRAKAFCLEVKIKLVRERGKLKPQGKQP